MKSRLDTAQPRQFSLQAQILKFMLHCDDELALNLSVLFLYAAYSYEVENISKPFVLEFEKDVYTYLFGYSYLLDTQIIRVGTKYF